MGELKTELKALQMQGFSVYGLPQLVKVAELL
jgi:hypothetical protein